MWMLHLVGLAHKNIFGSLGGTGADVYGLLFSLLIGARVELSVYDFANCLQRLFHSYLISVLFATIYE